MQVKDEVLTLLALTHKTGIGKTSGSPYDFYTVDLGDEEFNKLSATVGDSVKDFGGNLPDFLIGHAEEKRKVVVDLDVKPDARGYGVKLVLTKVRPFEE